jgi:hypothetical protein
MVTFCCSFQFKGRENTLPEPRALVLGGLRKWFKDKEKAMTMNQVYKIVFWGVIGILAIFLLSLLFGEWPMALAAVILGLALVVYYVRFLVLAAQLLMLEVDDWRKGLSVHAGPVVKEVVIILAAGPLLWLLLYCLYPQIVTFVVITML